MKTLTNTSMLKNPCVALLAGALAFSCLATGQGLAANGNANGHANGHADGGNGNGNSGHTSRVNLGKTASALGALNAAHASNQAFAHASPNSRIGKIKAYYLANQALGAAQTALQTAIEAASAANALVVTDQTKLTTDNAQLLKDQAALKLAPNDTTLQAAVATDQLAVTNDTTQLNTDTAAAAAANATVTQDQATMTQDQATVTADLNLAANKTPVSAATKAALDALLATKTIN